MTSDKFYVHALLGLNDKKFYTGFTKDLKDRLSRHARGEVRSTANSNRIQLKLYLRIDRTF